MAGSINVNQNNNKVILKDQNPNITITDNVHEKIVNVTPATTKIVEVRTPGPQGPKGNTGATGSLPSGILSSSIQIASDISGAFNSVSSSLASEVSSLIDATSSYALSSQISGSWQGFITSSGILSSSAQISGSWQGFITSSGIISSSAFSSPSQGTVRATINGTQTDVDTGLQTGDGVEFLNITASAITASSIKANTMEVIHLTSSFITASTVITTGSNVFGDEASDTHTFIGDIIAKNNITGSGYISTDTNITASGNISASGTIVANKIKSLGSEVILENGHITASGNISASGTGSFYELELDGLVKHIGDTNTQFGFVQNDEFSVTTAGVEMLQIDGTGTTFNVSAQDRDFKVSGNGGNLFILNDGSNRAVFPTITGFRIGLADNAANATLEVGGNISSSGAINTNSHITSSGNISASNTVIGNSFKFPDNNNILSVGQLVFQNASYDEQTKFFQGTNGDTFLQSPQSIYVSVDHPNESTDDIFVIGDSTIPGVVGSIFFKVDSNSSISQINHITASGNISASGDIIGNINATHITASGNISASGEIEALDYKIAGGKSAIDYNSSNTRIIYGQSNQNSRLRGNTITLGDDATQHVTASGHISASGNIFGSVIKGGAPLRGAHTSIQQNVISVPGHINTVKLQGGVDIGSAPAEEPVIVSDNGLVVLLNALESGHSGSFSIYNATNSTTVPGVNSSEVFAIDKGGNITASGNISSSGVIVSEKYEFGHGGSSAYLQATDNSTLIAKFGNSKFEGHITASGNISSSGNLIVNDIDLNGTVGLLSQTNQLQISTPAGSELNQVYFKTSQVAIGSANFTGNSLNVGISGLNVEKHITASGDISASGKMMMGTPGVNVIHEFYGKLKVIGSDVTIGNGHITASGNISSSGTVTMVTGSMNHLITDGSTIEFRNASTGNKEGTLKFDTSNGLTISDAGGAKGTLKVGDIGVTDGSNDIRLLGGNITASGIISASGTGTHAIGGDLRVGDTANPSFIRAQQYKTNDIVALQYSAGVLLGSTTGTYTTIQGTTSGGIRLQGHVTASANISSSGTIISNEINTIGHITASGNISSSLTSTIQAGTGSFQVLKGDTSQNTQLFVNGAITASNNISASGVVMGKNLNTEFIPIVPQDFNMDNVVSTRDYAGAIVNDGGAATIKTQGFQVYATKMIPKGFTATSGSIFGSDVNNNIKWYSGSLLVNTNEHINSSKIDAGLTDTGSAYLNGVVGDGLTYVTVEWTPGTGDQVYGGKIYMKPS